jgi:actin-related protein 8
MINFEGKRGRGEFKFWNTSEDITDLLTTSYDEPTGAMRQLTQHLLPALPAPVSVPAQPVKEDGTTIENNLGEEKPPAAVLSTEGTLDGLFPDDAPSASASTSVVVPVAPTTEASTTYDWSNVTFDIVEEASKSPLDGAIAAAIAMAGTENKVKAACMSILLIGGTSALKGIGAFVSER